MSNAYCHEENSRLSQRACHVLTGFYPSASNITFDDFDEDDNTSVVAVESEADKAARKWRETIEYIFGPSDTEDEEEVLIDYFEESEKTLEYNKTHGTRALQIDLIRKTQQFRVGEEYGAGDPCSNTDCFRDFTKNYFIETNLGMLCPDCILHCVEESETNVTHKDKRSKID